MTRAIAIAVLAVAGCGTTEHGVESGQVLVGGSGTATCAGTTYTVSELQWNGNSPAIDPTGQFDFFFEGSAASVQLSCAPADWSAVENAGPVDTQEASCSALISFWNESSSAYTTYSAPMPGGALTLTSALDSNGNGSLTIELTTNATLTLTSDAGAAAPGPLGLDVSELTADVEFHDVSGGGQLFGLGDN